MLTMDRDGLKKGIDRIQKPSGGTNFWDALRFVYEHVLVQSRNENRRSAVIVMTDGIDNALPDVAGEGSRTSFEELLQIVSKHDSIVLPIYLDTEKETLKQRQATLVTFSLARNYLARLAEETGGNFMYWARKVKDLDGVYEQVIRDLSMVYSIGYRPADRARDGRWRQSQCAESNIPSWPRDPSAAITQSSRSAGILKLDTACASDIIASK
jgi:VWFA-related protein